MKYLFKYIEQQQNKFMYKLRMCPGCGSGSLEAKILCKNCDDHVNKFRINKEVSDYKLKVKSLYVWTRENSTLISRYVSALKGGGWDQIYCDLAALLLLNNANSNRFGSNHSTWGIRKAEQPKQISFVPAPSRNNRLYDHAGLLSYWLAKLSGGEFLPILINYSEKQQKIKNRSERKRVKIGIDCDLSGHSLSVKRIVFVDDVITTGATALSAYRALTKPRNFEVWTLFYRQSLLRSESVGITR